MHVPFNEPYLVGTEQEYLRQSIARLHFEGDGLFTRRCSELLERALGARKVLLTTSCTHALEMCGMLLDLEPGDEVIVPSFAFVSTASAFVLRGARPVFADVREDTLNLDERRVEELVTPRTRAVVALHYGGVACELDALGDLARRHGLALVEDNAHGLFGRYRGRPLGTFGCLAALSFHATKNFTCGEGGALVVNEPGFVARAEIVREKGTDRSRFFRGEVDKYTWVDLGSSFLPSDLLAAFLFAQLEVHEEIQARRARVWERYRGALAAWAEANGVQLPVVPPGVEPAHHMFHMLMPSPEERDELIAHLRRREVTAVFHYLPLHLSSMGRGFGGREGSCPVAESASERLVRLPFFTALSEEAQDSVVEAVLAFRSPVLPARRSPSPTTAREPSDAPAERI